MAEAHGFACRPIPMKNTHHAEMTELLIGRDLSWFDAPTRVQEEAPPKIGQKRKPTPVVKPEKAKPQKRVTYAATAAKKARRKKSP